MFTILFGGLVVLYSIVIVMVCICHIANLILKLFGI